MEIKWKDVFTPPFSLASGMIFDAKGRISMNSYCKKEITLKILGKLNDEHKEKTIFPFNLSDGKDEIVHDGRSILLIRGWGRLTGVGGLSLDSELAVKLQNEFADWVVQKLNS
jgi:hypothetical protein